MTTPAADARAAAWKKQAPTVMVVLLIVDSLHFVWARLLLPYLPPVASSLYVLAIATVETAVYLGVTRQVNWQILRRHFRFFAVVGLLVAMATALSYAAIAYIDPGTAALVARMGTIFSLLLGYFWLKDRMRWPARVGVAVAVVGVFIIGYQPAGTGMILQWGAVLALASTLTYSLHTAVVKRYGDDIEFGNFFLFRVGSTTLFLLLFALWRGEVVVPHGRAWLYLLLAGTIDVAISRVLYYLALRRLSMSLHTILLTLSPVATILWSLALFSERPSTQGLVGGTAVLIGIVIVTVSRGRRQVE